VLIVSAVELVVGLLCFILFYHTFNTFSIFEGTRAKKITAYYVKSLGSARAFMSKFF
jgi:uncharacterized membrane protein